MSAEEPAGWDALAPRPGDVLEFITEHVPGFLSSDATAAFLVREAQTAEDGSLLLQGRSIGCDDEAVGKELSSLLNRKSGSLHLCWSWPCTVARDAGAVHVTRARLFLRGTFSAGYLKPWGRLVMREFEELAEEAEDEEEEPGRKEKPEKRKEGPKRKAKPGAREREKEPRKRPAARKAGGEPGDKTGKLQERLAALRQKLVKKTRTAGGGAIEISDSEERERSEEESQQEVEESERLGVGDRLREPTTLLAIGDVKEEEDQPPKKEKKTRKKVKKSKDPGAQLLAQAAQQRARGKERKDQKKKKKKGSDAVKALAALLTEKKDKKKGKRSRGKKKDGGDSGPGSSGSSSGGSEEDEEKSESSSSEMLAPLQKKSSRHPGTVLRLLVDHARQTLDQAAVVETGASKDVTRGVKMTTYFNLLIRPYHSSASRDMKELHQLAVCIDELRAGHLSKLGDSMASRFLAIHTAVNEGSWRSAQFMELHPLEPTQGAPTALLLETKKHGKLVQRSQSNEDWRRGRLEGDGWKGSYKGNENKGKGKGKGKDQGKGWQKDGKWQQGGGWNGPKKDWWSKQKEKPDAKDGGAPKTGGGEK